VDGDEVSVDEPVICPRCKGTGWIDEQKLLACWCSKGSERYNKVVLLYSKAARKGKKGG
jgi:DnaJ-class molecular chaperone